MSRLVARMLDARRVHVSDGPIDLVIEAWGSPAAIRRALHAAVDAARPVLDALCQELSALRAAQPGPTVHGPVARRMVHAVSPHARGFITPMAAVAGSVADHVLAAMVAAGGLDRAYVNNGGDIALHLSPGESFAAAMAGVRGQGFGTLRVHADTKARGIATSGWPGRSFSLGIADSVTVLAACAAAADAAATVIANAVDLPGHPAVTRVPARRLDPDSDLGDRLVTRGVGPLDARDRRLALARGAAVAARLRGAGLIEGAALHLQGMSLVEAAPALVQAA